MVVCDWLSYFDLKKVKNDSPHSTILSGTDERKSRDHESIHCVIVALSTGGNYLLVPQNLTLCWVLKAFQGSFSFSVRLPLTLRYLVLMETYLTNLLGCKHHQSSNAQIKYPVFFVLLFFCSTFG